MNLQQMREFVRAQLDLDDTDLPDPLLNGFLQQGYDLALGLENEWPFFDTTWNFPVDAIGNIALTPDVDSVNMLLTAQGRPLTKVDRRWAITMVGTATGSNPTYWSRSNRTITLYPKPPTDATVELVGIGFRLPSDWIALGASSECDADPRLHLPICWYACSLGYAQQEDEVLEQTYLARFKETVVQARDAIMRPEPGQPKQFSYVHWPSRATVAGSPQLVLAPPGPVVEKDTIIGGTP